MTSTVPGTGPGPTAAPGAVEPPRDPRGARSGVAWLLDLPAGAVRRLTSSAATTPGRLSLIGAGLVALSLLTGLVGTLAAQDRADTVDGLVEHREPLAAAAQELYRSLSDADATAASAFLWAGVESPELRRRYEHDIAKAGAALSKAASDTGAVPEAAEQIEIISRQLPTYTGLVETARVHDRQGHPVGAAYLREASALLRSDILPAAQRLYSLDAERLRESQDDATGFPWLTAALVLALLAALVAAQLYLKRRTNRVFNVGLLVATGAVGVAVLWTAVALTVQGVLVGSARDEGTEQADLLVRSRISALQARADETLNLVARGGGTDYDQGFAEGFRRFAGEDGRGGLLAEARAEAEDNAASGHLDSATEAGIAWLEAHRRVRELNESGDYRRATALATDPRYDHGSATAFTRLDGELAAAIGTARQNFVDETTAASGALTLLAPGFAVLSVGAALGATLGIRERLREYR
ncbi:hypothetical protein [Saccharomonospora saliphila]|uniref:hypothetical protein n=1 Tax=Saccharomonospora saliphila TaxID=369829 RepID=UPI00048D35D9|nr:hypothetical protein [Saccharomonospora saliphila]